MGVLISILYVFEVLVSVMLIGIVLIQQSKSSGGLGALAGGQTESIFGAATGNVITRTTVTLATIFMVNTLLLAIITGNVGGAKTRAEELAGDVPVEERLSGNEMELPEDSGQIVPDTPNTDAAETTETEATDAAGTDETAEVREQPDSPPADEPAGDEE